MSNATPLYQLSALLAQNAMRSAPPHSAAAQGAQLSMQSAQAAIQAEAMRRLKKREEEKEKKEKWGGIGSKIGSMVGVAAAPFTGGSSLALTAGLGALGGAAGGAAGELAAGGGIRPGSLIPYAMQGGLSGAMTWAAPRINSFLADQYKNQAGNVTNSVARAAQHQQSVNPLVVAANQRELATGINPFQARLAGVTQPATQMGAAPGTAQEMQASRLAAWQHPGRTAATQMYNYAQGQRGLFPGFNPAAAYEHLQSPRRKWERTGVWDLGITDPVHRTRVIMSMGISPERLSRKLATVPAADFGPSWRGMGLSFPATQPRPLNPNLNPSGMAGIRRRWERDARTGQLAEVQ